ncbi:MAG: hypothetical protein GY847_04280 [Proteobacteria bacterium]|nr:hypothetical protein [Pseudomonadota bacterium]
MGLNRSRDIVLMLACALLLTLALLPVQKRSPVGPNSSEELAQEMKPVQEPDPVEETIFYRAREATEAMNKHYADIEKTVEIVESESRGKANNRAGADTHTANKQNAGIDKTAETDRSKLEAERNRAQAVLRSVGVEHPLLPLIQGSTWLYSVSGHQRLIPGEKWTMKVAKVPSDDEPGLLEVGFDDDKSLINVWLDKGTVRIDNLPFVEPLEFFGNRPASVDGEFLPVASRIIKDAVWTHEYKRNVLYKYRNKAGKLQEILAQARQRDRARETGLSQVIVPAGRFTAYCVSWLSRIQIRAEERLVLKRLTSEPYRRETMWLAPDMGIIRRKIEYLGEETKSIYFDLISYMRPK